MLHKKMHSLVLLLLLLGNFIFQCDGSKLKLPSNIPQRLYCFGCLATVAETQKLIIKRRVTKKNRQSKIMDILENVCQDNSFLSYEYSPPKSVSACKLLLENHEDEIETAFVKDRSDIKKYICHELSQACDGIDTTEEREPSDNADLDLRGDGTGTSTKTIKIDPQTGKATTEKKGKKTEGKTMSKKSKSKKDKKRKEVVKPKDDGTQKGSLHHLNVDINDPDSMQRIMDQIKNLATQDESKDKKKDEL